MQYRQYCNTLPADLLVTTFVVSLCIFILITAVVPLQASISPGLYVYLAQVFPTPQGVSLWEHRHPLWWACNERAHLGAGADDILFVTPDQPRGMLGQMLPLLIGVGCSKAHCIQCLRRSLIWPHSVYLLTFVRTKWRMADDSGWLYT